MGSSLQGSYFVTEKEKVRVRVRKRQVVSLVNYTRNGASKCLSVQQSLKKNCARGCADDVKQWDTFGRGWQTNDK